MKIFAWFGLTGLIVLQVACGGGDSAADTPRGEAVTEAEVGKLLFEDTRLSANENQSCASCHDASKGFADPDVTKAAPVSEGSEEGKFGTRNAPTSAYAGFSPRFGKTKDSNNKDVFVGGQFMDGRQDTLEEQAKDPFLNPVEMANENKLAVVNKVKTAPYADKFKRIFGDDVFNNVDKAYNNIAHAIAAFERSDEMNKFNSKFDCYLQDPDAYPLDAPELAGLDLFEHQGKCITCHTIEPDPASGKVLLTNFQYFNIGVPSNTKNPANIADSNFVDLGLGDRKSGEEGKFKTPTLRNIAITAPYMHNGVFDTLKDVMDFYNIPDKQDPPQPAPAPEVDSDNINGEVNFLDLNDTQITNIIAFMETLTDGTGTCF